MEIYFWLGFSIIVSLMLYIDLYITDHSHGEKSFKSAAIWSVIWIAVAFIFGIFIYYYYSKDHKPAIDYITAYLVEKSLSVDNLFVFLMIFTSLKITPKNQPHILKWGIITAIIFRVVFILLGVELIKNFHFVIYIFGLVLLYAAYHMLKEAISKSQKEINLNRNPIIKFLNKFYKIDTNYEGKNFFYKDKITGKLVFTTSFLAFVLVESADLVFAVDSVPAVLAITYDPFIAITSNIMAILGLRALYFLLAGILTRFKYLKHGVSILLFYIGIKLLITDWYKIPSEISLLIIVLILTISIIISIFKKKF
ncbi:MAG TPA: TerC/Alx family metal homeostasis membrane protein [Ignavibacteriales bacterium]|nr:TerC/Alx family metal homeostasis membrane protein [Ignavibacteriales bacterium]HOM65185.1 TerC/Alx family metal homeostasis membrane protein [Ignavibacteriales bacterium]HPD66909.1 TerC/Alx family metal homeostasis membrane protein [Ignavibacteriales bacterium]HPP33748.1 TerC/Alx family metal homeostasis membrane protein [Ignavibacteriales bacterium]HRR18584.1 TerC/Alx family metal homeostasis membrane protein [Ignavibacteriales bacterium]